MLPTTLSMKLKARMRVNENRRVVIPERLLGSSIREAVAFTYEQAKLAGGLVDLIVSLLIGHGLAPFHLGNICKSVFLGAVRRVSWS
jgi:hypothetical protein